MATTTRRVVESNADGHSLQREKCSSCGSRVRYWILTEDTHGARRYYCQPCQTGERR